MDDVLFGANDLRIAIRARDELIQLMQSGGFTLHKWATNDPYLSQSGDITSTSFTLDLTKNSEGQCVLGLNGILRATLSIFG